MKDEAGSYIWRSHDEELGELIRSRQQGNFLLIGDSGAGKTAALKSLSDQLIDNGLEHQFLPSGRRRGGFVPPAAAVNLMDDVAVGYASPDSFLDIRGFLEGAKGSLNILAARPTEAGVLRRSLRISGQIAIPPLSKAEALKFLYESSGGKLKERWEDDALIEGIRGAVEFLEQRTKITPRNLKEVGDALLCDNGKFRFVNSWQPRIEAIRSELIVLKKGLLERVVKDENELVQLTPREFEELVGELFEREGYKVELTQASRDGGIDLLARKSDIAGETLTLVQCKKNSDRNPVRVGVVREVAGSLNIHRATAAAIFTTSRFTKTAIKEAEALRYRLSLNDYLKIVAMLASLRRAT